VERAEVMELLRTKAAELLDLDPAAVTEESSFLTDLEVDSLDIVEYMMSLEDDLGIELPEEELEPLKTVGDVATLVQAKLDAKV
jgi:acyl carrier protein